MERSDYFGRSVRVWERIGAWARRQAWLLRPFLILVAAVVLLWVRYFLFQATQTDSFWREVVSAAAGSVVTLAVAGFAALYALRHRLAAAREKRVVKRFSDESWSSREVIVGEMKIG